MKFARILKINDSRDEAQRILTLTYTNIKKRKDGTWIGTPITVERSVNDVVPVDNALNESMLNPGILVNEENTSKLEKENNAKKDENASNDETATNDENDEIATNDENTNNDDSDEVVDTKMTSNNNKDENKDEIDKEITTMQEIKDDNKHIRKSERIRKQKYEIHPDDIGKIDDEKDKGKIISNAITISSRIWIKCSGSWKFEIRSNNFW